MTAQFALVWQRGISKLDWYQISLAKVCTLFVLEFDKVYSAVGTRQSPMINGSQGIYQMHTVLPLGVSDLPCVNSEPPYAILTHWGRVTHICVSKLTIIGSDNGLSPDRRQAIIWTNARLLLIGPLGTNFSEILIEILTFSFKKMRLKVSSAKRRTFCLGLNVLTHGVLTKMASILQTTFYMFFSYGHHLYFDSSYIEIYSWGPIKNKSSLVEAWHRTDDMYYMNKLGPFPLGLVVFIFLLG